MVIYQIRNAQMRVLQKNIKALMADLKKVYGVRYMKKQLSRV